MDAVQFVVEQVKNNPHVKSVSSKPIVGTYWTMEMNVYVLLDDDWVRDDDAMLDIQFTTWNKGYNVLLAWGTLPRSGFEIQWTREA